MMLPGELLVPDMTMVLLLIVLLVAVTAADDAVRHCNPMPPAGDAGVLLLPVSVLLFMASVVGDPPVSSSMVPVPVAVLFVTLLAFRFAVPAAPVLLMAVKPAVVAAGKLQPDTVLPVRLTVVAEAVLIMPVVVLVVAVALVIVTVLFVMFTVLLAAVLPMPLSMPVMPEVLVPLASVMVLPVISMLAEGALLP